MLFSQLEDQQVASPIQSLFWHQTYFFVLVKSVEMADLTTWWLIVSNTKKDFTEISTYSVYVVTKMYCMLVEETHVLDTMEQCVRDKKLPLAFQNTG